MDRIFHGRKYLRSYIGGSKKKESEAFYKVQDTDGDFENCDWFNYRRMTITYFDDILHVMLSWEKLLFEISIVSILMSFLIIKFPVLASLFFTISLFSQIVRLILIRKNKKRFKDYEFILSIIDIEINKRFGLNLPK